MPTPDTGADHDPSRRCTTVGAKAETRRPRRSAWPANRLPNSSSRCALGSSSRSWPGPEIACVRQRFLSARPTYDRQGEHFKMPRFSPLNKIALTIARDRAAVAATGRESGRTAVVAGRTTSANPPVAAARCRSGDRRLESATVSAPSVHVTIRRIAELGQEDWAEILDFGSDYFEGAFITSIQSKRDLVQLRGGDGQLLGIGALEIFDLTHAQRTVTVFHAGNAAFADGTRGQGYVHRIGFRYFLRAKSRHPWRPVYVAFTTFSWRSYLSLTRNFKRYWPRHHTPLPA